MGVTVHTMRAPTFSIIVPTFRRVRKLERCLRNLTHQSFPKSDYEVIVVDDGAEEAVAELVEKQRHPIPCRLLTQNHKGPAAARNAGANLAQGRYLAFTDDDCRPAPDWLKRLEHQFDGLKKNALVGGRVINELENNPYASASQALVDFLCKYCNADPRRAAFLTSNNICLPAEAFKDIGGFDTSFSGACGEDREFCTRCFHAGYQTVYAPDVVVYHSHDLSLGGFIRQHFAYGRGSAVFRRRALDHGYGPIALEPAWFYWNLLRYPRETTLVKNHWMGSALFALAQAANGAGYVLTRWKKLRFQSKFHIGLNKILRD